MKRLILVLVALFTITTQVSAMSYELAREQALFLTDKMAYELNLTDEQYEAAYEINLDYLMSIDHYEDLYGVYWHQRNLDLSYILLDWQYRSYLNATYFYRPLYWDSGYWHFGIYARYPHRDYYYFGQPTFYVSYRGGHSWRMNGGRSWYSGRQFGNMRPGAPRTGMRDGFERGDYGRGRSLPVSSNRSFGSGSRSDMPMNRTRSFGGGNAGGTRSFGGGYGSNNQMNRTRSFGGNAGSSRSFGGNAGSTRSFGGNPGAPRSFGNDIPQSSTRATATLPSTSRSFGRSAGVDSPRSTFTPNSSRTRSFGGGSSNSAPTRSSGLGGGFSAPTRSFGGGGSFSGGTRTGGGHFGGGR